ncbi:hypothetical protein HUJ04_012623 [Dendroctonus ponderosae]|nr:hypothetical protein HUJ04_012623 [Dendroctonus ponderosae]KAH1029863.1 hypothetical protein HUJ05_003019 [Dendroctonus ponderosae]
MTQYLDRFIPSRTSINFDGFRVGRSTNDLYDVQLDDEDDALHRIFLNTARKANYLVNYKKRNGEIAYTNTGRTVCDCLKWNRTGSRIAVSRTKSGISIIDGATLKIHETVTCPCRTCKVTAFEWTKNNNIIAGCSTGSISVIGVTEIKYACRIVNDPIIDLQLSCDETYLMVGTKNNDLHIFQWPIELNGVPKSAFLFHSHKFRKCAAWHPWKNSILVIGYIPDNKISVWNINSRKCIDYSTVEPLFKKASDCILDYLTFCPMSGELVVSFYYENSDSDEDNGCNFLTVFSDLHTRVDEIRYHVGRVPYALWNQHGTKLATLSTDENLVIWDFFGKESKARIHAIKKAAKFPGIFDSRFQFGSFLR